MWFWRNGSVGRCYEESEQLPHGGAVYDGHEVLGYTPDHGPISNTSHIYTARFQAWKDDPYRDINEFTSVARVSSPLAGATQQQLQEHRAEEQLRRRRFQAMLQPQFQADQSQMDASRRQWVARKIESQMKVMEDYRTKTKKITDDNYKSQQLQSDLLVASASSMADEEDIVVEEEVNEGYGLRRPLKPPVDLETDWESLEVDPFDIASLPNLDNQPLYQDYDVNDDDDDNDNDDNNKNNHINDDDIEVKKDEVTTDEGKSRKEPQEKIMKTMQENGEKEAEEDNGEDEDDEDDEDGVGIGIGISRIPNTNRAIARFVKSSMEPIDEHRQFLQTVHRRTFRQDLVRRRRRWRPNAVAVLDYAIARSTDMQEEKEREEDLDFQEMIRWYGCGCRSFRCFVSRLILSRCYCSPNKQSHENEKAVDNDRQVFAGKVVRKH
jgi:hypothetical protein